MNIPSVEAYAVRGRRFIIVTGSRRPFERGCYWRLYDDAACLLSCGYSEGWDGEGAGSALAAPRLAKAAARRLVRKWERASLRRLGVAS